MLRPQEVHVEPAPLERFEAVVDAAELREALQAAAATKGLMEGRVFWNVNSTAVGGGVAEMLLPLIAYSRGAGVDARWIVIEGTPEFFRITKRLHHALHGSPGDGVQLDAAAHAVYEEVLRANFQEISARVRRGDVVLLHDPQTAGLAPMLLREGVHVVWRCHIGCDRPNDDVHEGWGFLARYLADIPTFVFSRRLYVPEICDHGKASIITPSIDAFSPKNRELDADTIRTVLVHTGLVEGPPPASPSHTFVRDDGSPGRVERRADVVRLGRAPSWDTPLVLQVSRWDPLKDPVGVLRGFAETCDGSAPRDSHLVLAGPNVSGVSDDPEGGRVFDEVIEAWRSLPHAVRNRVHLASLPTDDVEENAIIVNALQRHAAVVVQKSLQEGFGLTVTEAMWKARPVIASAVGGIQEQIVDGESGVLLDDPTDLGAFAAVLRRLLEDPAEADRLGAAARVRVAEKYLGIQHLVKYAALLEKIIASPPSVSPEHRRDLGGGAAPR